MRIFAILLWVLSAVSVAWADIPPAKNGEKSQDAGICAGVLLSVAAISILGRWVFKRTAEKRKMNKVKVILSVIVSVILVNAALADVPSPPVAREIRIELTQNYPDYQFYLCSYKITVKPNPNPPHPSRPDMVVSVPESFEQKVIGLSPDKPFSQSIDSHVRYRSDNLSEKVYWLVAVKKSQAEELEPKIKAAILNSTSVEGIKMANMEDSLPVRGDESKGVRTVVNRISLDEKGMKRSVEEGVSGLGSAWSCVGLGLLLTGLVLTGGWWARKRLI